MYTTLGLLSTDWDSNIDFRFTPSSFDCMFSIFTHICRVTGFGTETAKVDRATALNFQENNRQSYLIQNYLPPAHNYILLSANDIQQRPDGGWVSLSRIGFNSNFTQALVLLSQNAKVKGSVDICNEFYEVLQKANGTWDLQATIQVVDCELPPSQN